MSILTKILCFLGILSSSLMAFAGFVGFIALLVEGEVTGALFMLLIITAPSTALTVALSRKLHNSPAPTVSTGLPRYCMKCGQPLAAGMRFCQRCGAPAGSTGSPAVKAAPAKQPAAPITEPAPYAEYRYTPKGGDRYAQVKCPACGAENKLLRGAASVCQYCGQAISSVEQQKPVQLTNKEIMLAETAAVFERLLYSFDEELNAFNSCLEIINVTLNQNTGNDTCTRLSGSMLRFYTKTQNIVSGLRRQTTEFCDEMLTADEDTWQNHEVVSDALTTVREQLQELLPSIYELRASMQNLFVSRGVQRKVRQQTESCFDTAVTIITICCTTLSACLSDINDAKFTNTMTRMKLQREKQ